MNFLCDCETLFEIYWYFTINIVGILVSHNFRKLCWDSKCNHWNFQNYCENFKFTSQKKCYNDRSIILPTSWRPTCQSRSQPQRKRRSRLYRAHIAQSSARLSTFCRYCIISLYGKEESRKRARKFQEDYNYPEGSFPRSTHILVINVKKKIFWINLYLKV